MFDDLNSSKNGAAASDPIAPAGSAVPNQAQGGINIASGTGRTPAQDVEDIFDNTEALGKPAVFAPKQPGSPDSGVQDVENIIPSPIPKAVLVGLVVAAGLLLAAYSAYWGFNWWKSQSTVQITAPVNTNGSTAEPGDVAADTAAAGHTDQPAESPITDTSTATASTGTIQAAITDTGATAAAIDSDQDGLTDIEEVDAGTDVNNPDSDNDGLSDRQELKVYKTNPLNADTDGDGYTDGSEVSGGYNPNGAGKLFDIEKQ